MPAWYEDGELWAEFAPLMFDGKRWAEVPAVIDGIDGLLERAGGQRDDAAARGPRIGPAPRTGPGLRIKPGLRVLDSCCGPGRHSLELARRGCKVTGVDITEAYLEAARESASASFAGEVGVAEGKDEGQAEEGGAVGSLEFVNCDIRGFVRPASFDLVLNLFTSFGYFETPEEDLAALARFRECLSPGGALVLEVIGKETAARDFIEGEWFERDGSLICTDYAIEGDFEYLRNRWIVVREGRRFERSFLQRLYSAMEMRQALRAAGFAGPIAFFGNVDGAPYDQKAGSLVALAFA